MEVCLPDVVTSALRMISAQVKLRHIVWAPRSASTSERIMDDCLKLGRLVVYVRDNDRLCCGDAGGSIIVRLTTFIERR